MKNDDYEYIQTIGEGCTSKVCLVRDINNQKLYTIKKIHKKSLEYPHDKFMNEVNILKHLSSTNIIQYINHYECSRYYYIVMNYVEAIELTYILYDLINPSDYYDKCKPQEIDIYKYNLNLLKSYNIDNDSFYIKIICQLYETIILLYNNNIIHCDIIDCNILITKYYNLILIDFGLSIIHNDIDKSLDKIHEMKYSEFVISSSCHLYDFWNISQLIDTILNKNKIKDLILYDILKQFRDLLSSKFDTFNQLDIIYLDLKSRVSNDC